MLDVKVIPNGVLLPPRKDSSKDWGIGGVVDSNGHFVEDSIYRFYFGGFYSFDENEIKVSEEEVIYLGHLIPHWGVFLVDFTRRLWFYYKCQNRNVKLAFFGIKMPSIGFDTMPQMYHDFFKLADIDETCIIDVKKITRFKTVYVPEMAYDEDKGKCDKVFLLPFRRIINNLEVFIRDCHPELKQFQTHSKVYLSRKKFAPYRESGESKIEEFFLLNGFTIIYPEELSFIEKTLISRDAEIIASIEGTTASGILFSNKTKKQIIIRKQSIMNIRQEWLNKMTDIPLIYINCYYEPIPGLPYSWDEGPFLMLFNGNIKRFARENGMTLPKGIVKANIKAILHYLHIALLHFLQRHALLQKAIEPLFILARKLRK